MRYGRSRCLSVRFHDVDMFVLYCGLPSVACFYFRALLDAFSGLKEVSIPRIEGPSKLSRATMLAR